LFCRNGDYVNTAQTNSPAPTKPCLFLDLDRTLYPFGAGLQEAGDVLLNNWMADTLELALPEVDLLRRRLWDQYGTSARGLEHEYGIAQAEVYRNSIERLEPSEYLSPRPEVRTMLAELGLTAWVCTNATLVYARRVLAALELEDCFAGLLTIEAMQWHAKPHRRAYALALENAGTSRANAVFVDDAILNVRGAEAAGLHAVYCHPQPREPWSPHIPDITELPTALVELGCL
jgi:putative hydrolase of the HAD superfamily